MVREIKGEEVQGSKEGERRLQLGEGREGTTLRVRKKSRKSEK